MSDDPRDTAPGGVGGDAEALARTLAKEERAHTLTIEQRDAAQEAINAMYQAVLNLPPEWSSMYGFDDAVRDVEERAIDMQQGRRAAELQAAAAIAERDAALDVLREVAVLGHGKCTIGKPLAGMVRGVLDAVDSGAIGRAVAPILAERARQIGEEGLHPQADDRYISGELAMAAACYAISSALEGERERVSARYWPWSRSWWKPGDRRRDLARAGALIVAEIERLDREAAKPAEGAHDA